MKAKIRKVIDRILCAHWYWRHDSSLKSGSYCRGMIVCKSCGKRKLIEELKPSEVLCRD